MYSPGRGDARATALPNARDSSTSMPIDHASAWHREPYNRDARLDRGDRERIIGGKREWNSDRASFGAPYPRAFGGLHPVNGSLGPPNKRRLNGRHTGFHNEGGRYVSPGHRGEPPFGSVGPVENGLGRKFDRESFYPGSGCPVGGSGFGNGVGVDQRAKELEERHKKEPFLLLRDGRDGGSCGGIEHGVRSFPSQAVCEAEKSCWERERSKGAVGNGWESSQKLQRDLRERVGGKAEGYSRREGKLSQHDGGREWSQADKELEGRRVDGYGSSSRDGLTGDGVGGIKEAVGGCEWRRKERSSSVSASRSGSYVASSGTAKGPVGRPQALDVSGSASSPQVSPHSTASPGVQEASRDDGSQPSPPKRPRLGWGQGLAKYEKKKVVETDEVGVSASGGSVSGRERSSVSGATTEVVQTQESQAAEESPVSVVSNLSTLPPLTPSASPSQQAAEVVSKAMVECDGVEQEVVGKVCERVAAEAEAGGWISKPEGVVADDVEKRGNMRAVTECGLEESVRQGECCEALGLKESMECQASPKVRGSVEHCGGVEVGGEVGVSDAGSRWAKEDILLRVEKVEYEIEEVERELAKAEKVGSDRRAAGEWVAGVVGDEGSAGVDGVVKVEDGIDDGEAMDVDAAEVHPGRVDSRESGEAMQVACSGRNWSGGEECGNGRWGSDGAGAAGNVGERVGGGVSEGGHGGSVDDGGVLEEGELGEEKQEEWTSKQMSVGLESEGNPAYSPRAETEPAQREEMDVTAGVSKCGVAEKEEAERKVISWDVEVVARSLMEENKKRAEQARETFVHLLREGVGVEGTLYRCPAEAGVWKENVERHYRNQERMLEKMGERRQSLRFAEQVLAMRFRALKEAWKQEQVGMRQQQRGTKPVRRWEVEKRNGTALHCHRSSLRLRPVQAGMEKVEAVSEECMKKVMAKAVVGPVRGVLKMPSMIVGQENRLARRFESKNALVEDPVGMERERKSMNPWSWEEKRVFLEKFAVYNKNFSKIASHLELKTTADCVEFYYRNQKSEDFERIRRRQQLKKRRDYSRVGGSFLSTGLQTSSQRREANGHGRTEGANVQTVGAVVGVSHISVGTKAARSSMQQKPVERQRVSSALEPGSLPGAVEIGKGVSGKENKWCGTGGVSGSAAGRGGIFGMVLSGATVSCGLSSAVAGAVKIGRERSSVKTMVDAGLVVASCGQIEQHVSAPMVTGNGYLQIYLEKSAGKEGDAQWTDRERELFTEGVRLFGKDFERIAVHVGTTKSVGQCKAFFCKTRKRLGLDKLVEKYEDSLKVRVGAVMAESPECADVGRGEAAGVLAEDVRVSGLAVSAGPGMEVESDQDKGDESEKSVEVVLPVDVQEMEAVEAEAGEGVRVEEIVVEEVAVESEVVEVVPVYNGVLEDVPVHNGVLKEAPVDNGVLEDELVETPSVVSESVSEAVGASCIVSISKHAMMESGVCLTQSSVILDSVMKAVCEVPATVAHSMGECGAEVSEDDRVEFVAVEKETFAEAVEVVVAKDGNTGNNSTDLAIGYVVEEDAAVIRKDAESDMESCKCEPDTGLVKAVGMLAKISTLAADEQEAKAVPTVDVKADPESPQVATSLSTDSASFPSLPAAVSHSGGSVFSNSSTQGSQQGRERVGRVGGGETKSRREPTSWTQEEKEKFADIIRNHGKDWTRLHECLPSKSLTQIKTYFQNSKAKLGLLNAEGVNILGGRVAGSRKRKVDEAEDGSNNVACLSSGNELKGGGVSARDMDGVCQNVKAAVGGVPSMGMGSGPSGLESMLYPIFGQRVEDQIALEKFMRMYSANGLAQNIAGGVNPFVQQYGFPMFPNAGHQRASQLSLQQQLAASLAQKSGQAKGLQQQELQGSGSVQQSGQMVRNQQLLASMMQHQAAAHHQQNQTSKSVPHPLQPQVVVLQPGHAGQLQQQPLVLNQQVIHHPQAQQGGSQQEQGSPGHLVGNPSLGACSSAQVPNQMKQLLQHQALLQQQQQFQLALQHLQQQQQQQQLQQHQHHQDQTQAQVQVQAQAQIQALEHSHSHSQSHIHQPQYSLASLLQPLVVQKPKVVVPLPPQVTRTPSPPVLQQGGLPHRHDQHQHGPSHTFLRGNVASAVSSNPGEASTQQGEIGEQWGSISHGGGSKERNFSRADLHQLSGAGQMVKPSNAEPSRPATESPQARIGDVKLFGQSLLSQPTSCAVSQNVARGSFSAAEKVSLQQSPVSTAVSSLATSMPVPAASRVKPYGKESAFRGVPFSSEGRQGGWPPLGNRGSMEMWNIMNNAHSQVGQVLKSKVEELELHNMQECRMSREAQDAESDQSTPKSTHKPQHLEQARGAQDKSGSGGFSSLAYGVGKSRACVNEHGVSSGEVSRTDPERRGESIGLDSGCSERSSMMASRSSRGQAESFAMQATGPFANGQQVPRTVIDALMAIAELHRIRSSQFNSSVGQPRLEDHQWESLVQHTTKGMAVDAVKANPSLSLNRPIATPQTHLRGNGVSQHCVRDSGLYFTQHYPNLPGQSGVVSSAWNGGTGLVHPCDVQRMLVNPALSSFLPSALSRASTATEKYLGSSEVRDSDGGRDGTC
ncbi:uncharacterized protein [Physcomitrium patens]|uniref:uncharacterized protein isoform X4 n=1 Tax=Physcomitrium patens TaxID=3218 RepID=UPI000D176EE8|nr:uncharacterized protein LOC112289670 isoform X4 [Physcomitrium patens]|eukprot:XP_024390849.1 uncharacterized protein LOC112289670 isoform X4 [Physcomitrella patens]